MTEPTFDLLVIGGGPGGTEAARTAALLGKRVALVERDALGGTCLNRGCIPTKFFYHQAQVLRQFQDATARGIVTSDSLSGSPSCVPQIDLATLVTRKNELIDQLRKGVTSLLDKAGVTTIQGTAQIAGQVNGRLSDPRQIQILEPNGNRRLVTADRVLLATGSRPSQITFPGSQLPGVLDSTALLDRTTIPRELVIIGGGVIGIEFASIFHEFGSHVTIIEALDAILPLMDRETGRRLAALLKRRGIDIHTGTRLLAVTAEQNQMQVAAEDGAGLLSLPADCVLVAVGRTPEFDSLALEEPGTNLDLERNGRFLAVDTNYETSLPGIYAIGDLIGHGMLAHVAEAEARAVVEAMFGQPAPISYDAVPGCVFTFPEMAGVGLTSEQAAEENIPVTVHKALFAANGKARAMGESDGFVKVLVDAKNVVVGIHIIGPHASDLIAEATLIVTQKMTLDELRPVIHTHPTLSEVLAAALK